jgi:predicted deacylase
LSIHQVIGLSSGPKLIVLGAVHGNETCGTEAIRRLVQELEQGRLRIERGTLTMVPIANPLAYRLKRRHGGIAITLECGQHEDEQAPQVAYDAVRRTLAHLGMVTDTEPSPTHEPEVIGLYRVVDRLHPYDRFSKDWRSFESINRGEVLAYRHDDRGGKDRGYRCRVPDSLTPIASDRPPHRPAGEPPLRA